MDYLPILKTSTDDIEISYDYAPAKIEISQEVITTSAEKEIAEIDRELCNIGVTCEQFNDDIERLTNDADKLDYAISVASGVITGAIDVLLVGEVDLANCHKFGEEKVNSFVKKLGGSDNLEKAIKNLEKKTLNFASDPNLNDFGGGLQHHLRDFAHHPTLIGLVFSILTQFTKHCYGTDVAGNFICPKVKDLSRIGKTPLQKLVYATVFWFLHLVSDMAGSSSSAGAGTGLPGPILSLAKEMSALPVFNKFKVDDIPVSQFISKIFNGTLFADHDEKGSIIKESVTRLDLRAEIGIAKKQVLPVILNEVIVRTFCSIRRLITELKQKTEITSLKDLTGLNWAEIMPFGNRTVERMVTISASTFTAIDLSAAAIKGVVKSGGNAVGFAKTFILNVNFVGTGRCIIAVSTDMLMGLKLSKYRDKRIQEFNNALSQMNAKIYFRQEETWIEIENTEKAIQALNKTIKGTIDNYLDSMETITDDMNIVSRKMGRLKSKNPSLAKKVKDILEW